MPDSLEQRDVLVIMPFGGQNNVENRRCVLNLKRLEQVISSCDVNNVDSKTRISYSVRACKVSNTADINDSILDRIRNADIVIALFSSSSATVVYEAAVRHLMRDGLILVVDTQQQEFLPFYLRGLGYCPWSHESAKPVLDRIDRIANDNGIYGLENFQAQIPRDLADAVDDYDDQLKTAIQDALRAVEAGSLMRRPPYVRAIAGGMLGGIMTDRGTSVFGPTSVVAVAFKGHKVLDEHRPPIVCEYNNSFVRLYGYPDANAAELDSPLTAGVLLGRLERLDLLDNFPGFVKEQAELQDKIINNLVFRWATVPMQMSTDHPNSEFQGKRMLPCVVAMQSVGNLSGRHTTYLMVIYIDVTLMATRLIREMEGAAHDSK